SRISRNDLMATSAKKTSGKRRVAFVCSGCGHTSARWMGRCPACEEWDSMVEEAVAGQVASPVGVPIPLSDVDADPAARIASGWGELDRVLGGGIVPGSLILLAGEPG